MPAAGSPNAVSWKVDQLLNQILDHQAQLSPEASARWLLKHRLLLLHDHPRLREETRTALGHARRHTLAQNLLRVHEFQEICELLDDVPVLPLKGIVLLDTQYRHDISLRPMSDIDILVPDPCVPVAMERLQRAGWHELAISIIQGDTIHHRILTRHRSVLELHTRLDRTFAPGLTWENLSPVCSRLHDQPVHQLPPATDLLYRVIHWYRHEPFSCLVWYLELLVAEAACPDDGTPALARLAEIGRCRNVLAAALHTLRQATPGGFLESFPQASLKPNALRQAIHRITAPQPASPLSPTRSSSLWSRRATALLMNDNVSDTATHLMSRSLYFLKNRFFAGALNDS